VPAPNDQPEASVERSRSGSTSIASSWIPVLALSIVLRSVASLLNAFAASYDSLLLTRLPLGAITATAGPAIASLIGGYFPRASAGACRRTASAGSLTST
jgi:hypothetical protein